MGNCVSDVAQKYEVGDEHIISSCSSKQLQGLIEQRSCLRNNNNRVCKTEYVNARHRRCSSVIHFPDNHHKSTRESGSSEDNTKFIIIYKPRLSQSELRKPCRDNIQSVRSQQHAGERGVRRLKVVISAKEFSQLLLQYDSEVANNCTEAALASLVLEKLSMQGEISPCENGSVMIMNSARRSTSSVQSNGNYNYNSWRPSLEDIPEAFTVEG